MKWKIDPKYQVRCRNEAGHEQYPEHVLCVQSLLPETKVAIVHDTGKELRANDIHFRHEKPLETDIGYQLPCKGDSGYGHWISDGEKSLLVGITTTQTRFCGYGAHIQRIADSHILQWIKTKAF